MSIPYLYPIGLGADSAVTTTITLPANGGSIAVPFLVTGMMDVLAVQVRTLDTSGTHTLEMVLYADGGEDGPAGRMQGSFNSFSYTATAAANRAGVLSPAVRIGPGVGCYWLVIRNASAVPTLLAGPAAAAAGVNVAATATIASTLSEASITSAAWTATATCPLARLNGAVFAMGGASL